MLQQTGLLIQTLSASNMFFSQSEIKARLGKERNIKIIILRRRLTNMIYTDHRSHVVILDILVFINVHMFHIF